MSTRIANKRAREKREAKKRLSLLKETQTNELQRLTKNKRGSYKTYDIKVTAKIVHSYYLQKHDWLSKRKQWKLAGLNTPNVKDFVRIAYPGDAESKIDSRLSFFKKLCGSIKYYKEIGFTHDNTHHKFPWDLPVFEVFVDQYKHNTIEYKIGKRTIEQKVVDQDPNLDVINTSKPIKLSKHTVLLPRVNPSNDSKDPTKAKSATTSTSSASRNITLNTFSSHSYLTRDESAALCAWTKHQINISKTKTIKIEEIKAQMADMLKRRGVALTTHNELPGKKWVTSFFHKWRDEIETIKAGKISV